MGYCPVVESGFLGERSSGAAMWGSPAVALLILALAVLAPTAASAETGRPSAPERRPAVVALDPRLEGDERATRLAFTVTAPLDVQAFVLERPDRVVVELPEVSFGLGREAGRKGLGLLRSYRFGLFAPGRSRLVIDLSAPALVARITTEPAPGGDGLHTVTLELKRAGRDAFARQAALARSGEARAPAQAPPAQGPSAQAAASVPAASLPLRSRDADRRPLVVVDPGHGGVDPGARGEGGVLEKDLVLSVARELHAKLLRSGRYRVLLTREGDSFVALGQRVSRAREAGADLFVSLHADIMPGGAPARGATVYTSAERASDAGAARLAATENEADAAAGLDGAPDVEEVADILSDLTRRETRVFSHQLAGLLVKGLGHAGGLTKQPHRSAGFKVLSAPDVPSVLVELGYLSNRQDTERLMSDAGRGRAAESLLSSVDAYFARRLASGEAAGPR